MSDEDRLAEQLRSLNRELRPPAGLENRVVDALRHRDLIRPAARSWRSWQAVAALMLLTVGFLAGRWQTPWQTRTPSPSEEDQSSFMLLLYESEDAASAIGPELARQQFDEYSAWAGRLERQGRFLGGDPLAADGRLLREVEGQVREASGLAPERQILSGYFMIRARDVEEAIEVARECPHLRYDGTVAVRPVGH